MMSEANIYITQILLHVSHIPVITLIIITLFGKENEDAKWLVFHTALLNLVLGIIWEVTFIYKGSIENSPIQLVMQGVLKLAVNSTFPLAFTRFFYMYFQKFYVKIFNTKTLLPWLLVYDGILAGLYCWEIISNMPIAGFITNFIILLGTIVCTACIFLKLKSMMKMAQGTTLSILKDLRKAAFICIFQGTGISLHIIITLYVHIYSGVYMGSPSGCSSLGQTTNGIYPTGVGLVPSGGGGNGFGPPGSGGSGLPGGSGPQGGGGFGPPGGGSGPSGNSSGGSFGPQGGGSFGPPGGGSGPSGNGPGGSFGPQGGGGFGPPGRSSDPSGNGPGGSFGPSGGGSTVPSNSSNSDFKYLAWTFLKDYANTLYQFFVIIDTIVTLSLLRTYRTAFKIVGMKVWGMLKKFLPCEKDRRREHVENKIRPSVITWNKA